MAKQSSGASFTDTKRVRDLVALMAENNLTEIELVEDKSKITLKRGGAAVPPAPLHGHAPAAHHVPAPAGLHALAAAPAPAPEDNLVAIKSPMVGTFYTAANPDSDPYVGIGSDVGDDSVVCIIEAMKVFNEIRAETSGTIAKILVQNGQVVEYNQPLFLVKPV